MPNFHDDATAPEKSSIYSRMNLLRSEMRDHLRATENIGDSIFGTQPRAGTNKSQDEKVEESMDMIIDELLMMSSALQANIMRIMRIK